MKALAVLFQKHPLTIYRWIAEGILFPNSFKVGDGWYVPEKDVKQLLQLKKRARREAISSTKPQPKPLRAGFVNRW